MRERYADELIDEGWGFAVTYYDSSYSLSASDFRSDASSRENTGIGSSRQQILCNLDLSRARYILEKNLRNENNSQVQKILGTALGTLN